MGSEAVVLVEGEAGIGKSRRSTGARFLPRTPGVDRGRYRIVTFPGSGCPQTDLHSRHRRAVAGGHLPAYRHPGRLPAAETDRPRPGRGPPGPPRAGAAGRGPDPEAGRVDAAHRRGVGEVRDLPPRAYRWASAGGGGDGAAAAGPARHCPPGRHLDPAGAGGAGGPAGGTRLRARTGRALRPGRAAGAAGGRDPRRPGRRGAAGRSRRPGRAGRASRGDRHPSLGTAAGDHAGGLRVPARPRLPGRPRCDHGPGAPPVTPPGGGHVAGPGPPAGRPSGRGRPSARYRTGSGRTPGPARRRP